MKKYKLLKKYPSLPTTMEVGFEVEWNERVNRYHHAPTLDLFYDDWVENFPEFWEEVGIKEFKILTQVKDGYLFDEVVEGDGISVCVASVVSKDNILKVKRLSDGEVFTLGDSVALNKGWEKDNCVIYAFKMYECGTLKVVINENGTYGTYRFPYKFYHVKKSLFTTEDGVELFDGDSYYRVLGDFTLSKFTINKTFSNSYAGAKFFSTSVVAKKYIKQNKPILSLKDLAEIMEGTFTKSIKELLKDS